MGPLEIAAAILQLIRAGGSIAEIMTEVEGQASPGEWQQINEELDAAVEAWKNA